ncbi:hypothetical protein [Sphingomonas sp. IBVSS2]|uniref:PIN-like domain-containing protein n=1 Tax=Sphingomonas sp. IBVSS2 TaxID=1985172 RepID=UPI001181A9EC|nr:hypothetical protein [Sphingomonas sp. IBVSS2]
MKIRADEHVAQAIIRAINDIALSDGFELSSVVGSGQRGSSDVHWITAFVQDGGEAILTADTDFIKEPPQVLAIQKTGVRVIHLPSGWANAALAMQAAHLLMWWRRIENQLAAMKPRECYSPSYSLNEDAALRKVSLDFQAAAKKQKKAERHNRGASQ